MKIEFGQAQKMLEWLKTKLYLDSIAQKARLCTVKRGQVYRCNFGCGIGSEMQKERPAVIIQNDVGNNRSGNTIVIPITHDISTVPCVANITPQTDTEGNVILDGQANVSNWENKRRGKILHQQPADGYRGNREGSAWSLDGGKLSLAFGCDISVVVQTSR